MTEDQAKTKWCPMSRLGTEAGQTLNRLINMNPGDAGDWEGTRCLASGCMMWRWLPAAYGAGYCGLAGADGAP